MINNILYAFKQGRTFKTIKTLISKHPYLAFGVMFVGMPLGMMFTVALLTTIITFPISLIGGWL